MTTITTRIDIQPAAPAVEQFPMLMESDDTIILATSRRADGTGQLTGTLLQAGTSTRDLGIHRTDWFGDHFTPCKPGFSITLEVAP